MWRSEDLEIKGHFKRLAIEDDQRHKAMFQGYRYSSARRIYLPLNHLEQNPMDAAKIIIAQGYGEVSA